jgi:AcrR family transcriptional regulator
MVPSVPSKQRVRPPMQERSRQAWENILEAGTWILIHEGHTALTIGNVCERAGVAATAIYRRVDGLAGLFWAIYDRGMAEISDTYRNELARAAAYPDGSKDRVDAVVRAVTETFERHTDFLHPIINYSTSDPDVRDRGSRESLELVAIVAGLLPAPDEHASWDVARLLHQECVFRAMYGDRWLSREPEGYDAFVSRLSRVAESRLSVI